MSFVVMVNSFVKLVNKDRKDFKIFHATSGNKF